MLGCRLQGGLGNMMFQIAALEDMGRRSGFETCYPERYGRLALLIQSADHSSNAMEYLRIFKNFQWDKHLDKSLTFERTYSIPHEYVNIKPTDSSVYMGYFQSERYFEREATLKLFEPAGFITEELDSMDFSDACSIHIRHGDYVGKYNGTYFIPSMDYYNAAMEEVKADRYLIFSDDLPWCTQVFKGSQYMFISDHDFIELFMMSRCKHNIIANSSFSWWGSYLNQNPDKKIVAPSSWYTTYKYSSMDIYCNNWIII